jgi:hypothetical protein
MKRYLYLLVLGLVLWIPSQARADSYTCNLRGTMSGVAIGFIFDGEFITGHGVYTCIVQDTGHAPRTVQVPVRLALVGGGLGFDFTIIQSMNLIADGIGEVRNPRDLLGEFNVGASAGVTLINRGYNIDSAISVKHRGNGIGFEVGFIGERAIGLGARVNGFILSVKPERNI